MSLDPIRHVSVFPPHAFGSRRVDVIGVGATGVPVARMLADIGVENLHLHDFDTVADHNLANSEQFGLAHVGQPKVQALANIIEKKTGHRVTTHTDQVDGTKPLGEVVFLLTDTMASRKEIWEKGLKYNIHTKLLIETRMGADGGRVYALNPNKPAHIHAWEAASQYTDAEADASVCAAPITVGSTASIIAGLAVWQMIRWFSVERGEKDLLDNEIIFGLRSTIMIPRRW